MPPTPPPRLLRAPMMATPMRATIRPYSIAVAPRLLRLSLRSFVRIASTPPSILVHVHAAGVPSSRLTTLPSDRVNAGSSLRWSPGRKIEDFEGLNGPSCLAGGGEGVDCGPPSGPGHRERRPLLEDIGRAHSAKVIHQA